MTKSPKSKSPKRRASSYQINVHDRALPPGTYDAVAESAKPDGTVVVRVKPNELHPTGDFIAVVESLGDFKDSRTHPYSGVQRIILRSEETGEIINSGIYCTYAAIAPIRVLLKCLVGKEVPIRVKHRNWRDETFAEVDIRWNLIEENIDS